MLKGEHKAIGVNSPLLGGDQKISSSNGMWVSDVLKTGQWQHIAGVWDGTRAMLFVDGRKVSDGTYDEGLENGPCDLLLVGGSPGRSVVNFHGQIRELRISKTPRYTNDFQPVVRLLTDAHTVALYRGDSDTGDVLRDISGNNHHGKIVGAKWVRADQQASPGVSEPTASALDAITPTDGWVDIKKLIDPAADTKIDGSFTDAAKLEQGELLLGHRTSLSLPVTLEGGYQLRAELTTWNGPKFLHVSCPIAASQPLLVLADGDNQSGYVGAGLQTVDGRGARDSANPTHVKEPVLISDQKQVLVLTVASKGEQISVKATVDGKPMFDWTGPAASLPGLAEDASRQMTVSTYKGMLKFHTLQLKMLDGQAKLLRPEDAAKIDRTAALPGDAPPLAIAPFDSLQAKQHQQAWADFLGLPVKKEVDVGEGVKMSFMLIPPGEFMMGSSDEEIAQVLAGLKETWRTTDIKSEGPRHRVKITKPFYMSAHEVTVGQFKAFVDAESYKTEAETSGGAMRWSLEKSEFYRDPKMNWRAPGFTQADDHPIVNLTWKDVEAFGQWLSRQQGNAIGLPTEAQWEYACRAGTETAFAFGAKLDEKQWHVARGAPDTVAVGSFPPNAFGLYDMHGNGFELCRDWYSQTYYGKSPESDPTGPDRGDTRVFRDGGALASSLLARSANRRGAPLDFCVNDLGFRLMMPIDTAQLHSSSPAPADPDRAAAEWVLKAGGNVKVSTDEAQDLMANSAEELPAESFRVTIVDLANAKGVDAAGLETLAGLNELRAVRLTGVAVTEAGIAHLQGCKKLTYLAIDGGITAEAEQALTDALPALKLHVAE